LPPKPAKLSKQLNPPARKFTRGEVTCFPLWRVQEWLADAIFKYQHRFASGAALTCDEPELSVGVC